MPTPKDKLRVLVIEDSKLKLEDIERKFKDLEISAPGIEVHVDHCTNYTDACDKIGKSFFDVVILDMKIPLRSDGQDPRFEYSKSIYEQIQTQLNWSPFLIVGLSAFDPDQYLTQFAANPIFFIEDYRKQDWFPRIKSRIEFVLKAKTALRNFLSDSYDLDLILLTARKISEFDPVSRALDWVSGTEYEDVRLCDLYHKFGKIRLANGNILRAGIVCLGSMGLSTSAAITVRLILNYRPKYFAMVGMCCGFKSKTKTKLGDIVIARTTSNWDEGKYRNDKIGGKRDAYFHSRTVDRSPHDRTEKLIDKVLEAGALQMEDQIATYYSGLDLEKIRKETPDFVSQAKVHFGHMVSGSSVVDNLEMIDKIVARFPTAIALEMEAHSIYSACSTLDGAVPHFFVVKGVADHGDGQKKNILQPIASSASAMLFLDLLGRMMTDVAH